LNARPQDTIKMAIPSTTADIQEVSPSTQALAKRVLRKIDTRILLIMFITYNLNFMDKTILSSAAVFGLTEDNHLHGNQYSWVGSLFYFGYLFFEYPTTILIQRLPVGKYLAEVCLAWGAIVASTAACSSFGGLATVRFLLGVAVCMSTQVGEKRMLMGTGSYDLPGFRVCHEYLVHT